MKSTKSRQMKSDKLILDEIEYFILARQTVQGDTVQDNQGESVNPTTSHTNVSPNNIDVDHSVTALLDLGISNFSSEYKK